MPRRPAMAGDDIMVHVDWLARRLTQQQEDAAAMDQYRMMVSRHRVARVPAHLRVAKRDAYTPGLVAIGPLHAGDSERRLRPGHRLKLAYLNSLICRGNPDPASHGEVIQNYVRLVAGREREARAMYAAEDVDDLSAEDFIQMLVRDGCFIIEHLVNVAVGDEEPSLHASPFRPTQLSVDLVLAENQMPFFVLVELIKMTRLPEFDSTGFDKPTLLMKLVLYHLAGEKGRDMSDGLPNPDGVSHILHLLHATVTAATTRWVPPPPRIQEDGALLKMWKKAVQMLQLLPMHVVVLLLHRTVPEDRRWSARYEREDLPSASDLKRMWVRFKKPRGGATSKSSAGIASVLGPVPLAVRLEHEDLLWLPQLRIEFRTVPLLLNLVAFEQQSEQRSGDVSAYAWLMAKMVQSPEDAGVLLAAEVVRCSSTAGSESVARFFREVDAASEAPEELDNSYLREVLGKLRQRSLNPLLRNRADVLRYYINVPWRLIAAFVTVVTTVASILQTIAAFKFK